MISHLCQHARADQDETRIAFQKLDLLFEAVEALLGGRRRLTLRERT